MEDLTESVREHLESQGVDELFPVQQATFKLFTEGEELIVKSRTGTGKTLSFLLPLEELINNSEGKE